MNHDPRRTNDVVDVVEVRAVDAAMLNGLSAWGWVSYLLHFIVAVTAVVPGAQVSVVVLLVALVIDLVKQSDAHGTWHESHFSWRLRSVIWAGILYVVTAPLWLLFFIPGWIAWCVISIWFLYRIVRGMFAMNKHQPLP